MDNEHGEFALDFETLPDTDSEELAALIQRLRAELLDLDVDRVEPSRRARRRRALREWSCSRSAARWSGGADLHSGRRAIRASDLQRR